jgi:20S proteasome subunit beta 7
MELSTCWRSQRWEEVSLHDVDVALCSDRYYARFLAYVDLLGTTYSASTLATGYGAYIAQPLLRSAVENNEDTLTEEAARKILEDSMRVLYYRDARSINKVSQSLITSL